MFRQLKKVIGAPRSVGRGTALAALRYGLVKAFVDRRHRRTRPRGALVKLGSVKSYQNHERGLIITAQRATIRLTVIAPDCIQVRLQPSGKFPVPFSYSVAKVTWPDVQFSISETDDAITLTAPEIICQVNRADATLTFKNARGEVISQDAEPLSWREGEVRCSRSLPTGEACLGLAAQPTALDLRGRRYLLWNTDPVGLERNQPTYFTIPFYLGVHKTFACGLFWDNSSRGYVDVGAQHKDRITFSGSVGELRYYIFSGPDLNAVLQRYTELTGRMPMPPMWALGFHISRWSYYPADKVREITASFRKRKIPCDAIYLDIHHMDGYRSFTWDSQHFPAPAVLLSELGDQGFKTVAIVDPGIKIDPAYKVYDSGLREDVFLKYPNGRRFIGPSWPGNAVYPDFTSPKARHWWATQFDILLRPGIAGIWNDMNEPVIFNVTADNVMPDAVRHDFESLGANHAEAHNVYGTLMARASREALEKYLPSKRPFNITRAAFAGTQRYASSWTGNSRSTWDHLRLSVSMVINSGLSGLAFNGADVGGFSGNPEPELYIRWMQLGALLPYFRVHSTFGSGAQEPWAFGEPYEEMARNAIELRYQLLPYLYSAFAQHSQTGMPILRPLFTVDPTDDKLRTVDDAFMVGDTLLVAPVLNKNQTEREIYLPRGRWFDYRTNQLYYGGQLVRVPAPLAKIPIFARAGQVIPLWPIQQYVGQATISELRLKIYAGNGDVTLYEDRGEGTEYLNGDYRWLYFTCKMLPEGGMSIDWRRAGKYQPPYQKVRCEVYGIGFEPKDVQIDGLAAPLWYFEQGIVEFTANKPFSNAKIVEPDTEKTLTHSPLK